MDAVRTGKCAECGEPTYGAECDDAWHGTYSCCIALLQEKIGKLEAKNKELNAYIEKLHSER
jgi:hypothetical protein